MSNANLVLENDALQDGPLPHDRIRGCVQLGARAAEVFGQEKALAWLERPNRALGSIAPLTYYVRTGDLQTVMDVMGRVEHGVYE